jgi:hypothetical protein
MFYYVWKLSYFFGRRYAQLSIAFEELSNNPDACLSKLFEGLNIPRYQIDGLRPLIEKPRAGRWRAYATDAWFGEREAKCEAVLAEFFGQTPVASESQSASTRTRERIAVPASITALVQGHASAPELA